VEDGAPVLHLNTGGGAQPLQLKGAEPAVTEAWFGYFQSAIDSVKGKCRASSLGVFPFWR